MITGALSPKSFEKLIGQFIAIHCAVINRLYDYIFGIRNESSGNIRTKMRD